MSLAGPVLGEPLPNGSSEPAQDTASAVDAFTADQLDTLVAPIALYPDPLLSQILVASTYPLELVQAGQWLEKHTDLKDQALLQAAEQEKWDPSVQALVVFPDVVRRLNKDVTWTTTLGNAFLAHEEEVMDAVQRMRVKAQEAGKLSSDEKQTVKTVTESGKTVVEIAPADPEVIYIPEYDPVWIWGPARYYYYPVWFYRPRPPFGIVWYWSPAVRVNLAFVGWRGWPGWGWRPHWFHRTVVVNNYFIRGSYRPLPHSVVGYETVWRHNHVHRLGVRYPNRVVATRVHAPWRPHWNAEDVRRYFRHSHPASPHIPGPQGPRHPENREVPHVSRERPRNDRSYHRDFNDQNRYRGDVQRGHAWGGRE